MSATRVFGTGAGAAAVVVEFAALGVIFSFSRASMSIKPWFIIATATAGSVIYSSLAAHQSGQCIDCGFAAVVNWMML